VCTCKVPSIFLSEKKISKLIVGRTMCNHTYSVQYMQKAGTAPGLGRWESLGLARIGWTKAT
jgi:hypothetical protein